MAPPKKVSVTLAAGVRTRLESMAAAIGLDLEAYVVSILSGHVIGAPDMSRNRGGRPITAVPDDLPADIERANNVTGFVGVAKVGRLYTARVGRQLIGRFSSAELAASVRYHAIRGFRLGRGAMFAANGLPVEEAIEMAARAGFAFEAAAPEVSVERPNGVDEDEIDAMADAVERRAKGRGR